MVDPALYPFKSRFFNRGGLKLHYIDEGAGEPVVMLHGNPTWSFYFRKLVLGLQPGYRIIVPDHIGCGFSDKPADERYTYTLKSRVDDLEALLDGLGLKKGLTLLVHDWGGAIGMAYAARRPESVKRLVLLNTAAFHPPSDKTVPWPIRLARTYPWGPLLVRGLNAFSLGAAYTATVKPLTRKVRQAYAAPYDNWANRIAVLRFVEDIPLARHEPAYDVISLAERGLERFRDTPTLICWGGKDFVFDEWYLQEWMRRLPRAQVRRFPSAGHYILEDAAEGVTEAVAGFLKKT